MTPLMVLEACAALQRSKGRDYQSAASTVRQADYYPHGCQSIYDTMHTKMLRIKSVMDAMEGKPDHCVNYESVRDSALDLINYASFFVSYMDGGIDGQSPDRDWLNRPLPTNEVVEPAAPQELELPF
jgi:hypothetical protein